MYAINVGVGYQRPELIQRGVLEKKMGQSSIIEQDFTFNKRQECWFPNITEAWGVRVINGSVRNKDGKELIPFKDIKENEPFTKIDVKDPEYRGQVTFLPWGDSRGQMVVCRYLKQYSTIDLNYQNIVLEAERNLNENDESVLEFKFIQLLSGETDFDETKNEYLVQHLKIHDYNRSSTYKNPNIHVDYMFEEKKVGNSSTIGDVAIDKKFDCFKLVNDVSSDNTGAQLKNLYNTLFSIAEKNIKEDQLFSYLKSLADKDPEGFYQLVNDHKRSISDLTMEAQAHDGFLDTTTDGVIKAGSGVKKKELATGLNCKGEDMLQWLYDNPFHPTSIQVCFDLKKLTEKLK